MPRLCMHPAIQLLTLLLLQPTPSSSQAAPVGTPIARFPLQFTANLTITANQIPPETEYPPRERTITIAYDYPNLRARADIHPGYEAAKTYIRLYSPSVQKEYMIRHPPISDCKRSLLTELMPYPLLPPSMAFVKFDLIDGTKCAYFLYQEHNARVHVYFVAATGAPRRLIQEATEGGMSTPMLTYDYSSVVLGPPGDDLFALPPNPNPNPTPTPTPNPTPHPTPNPAGSNPNPNPAEVSGDGGMYTDESCARHVAGFPYLHVWHHFVKF